MNNVEVELILRENISESTELYRKGNADGLFNVFPDIIMLNSDGIHTKVVYIADRSETGDVIVGRPEFTSLADLKGKKVSFEGINSFSHLFVLKALEESGIEEYDVAFENVSAMGVLNALEENKIDVGHTWEPVTSEALKGTGRSLICSGCPGFSNTMERIEEL
ncbi:unnamed protein product [marine sediment metagenome]|uniref:SsuA/THI5-like domain-containing protein n=1 Tax=marine sediment metagenome TaxID=412755 RepID=X0YVK6_9ZZZZ